MRKLIRVGSAGLLVVATAMLGWALPARAADNDSADVSVLHAVPGATVDVYADGDPRAIVDPGEIDAGYLRTQAAGDGRDLHH